MRMSKVIGGEGTLQQVSFCFILLWVGWGGIGGVVVGVFEEGIVREGVWGEEREIDERGKEWDRGGLVLNSNDRSGCPIALPEIILAKFMKLLGVLFKLRFVSACVILLVLSN